MQTNLRYRKAGLGRGLRSGKDVILVMKRFLTSILLAIPLAAQTAETEIDRALRAISSTEARFVHRFRQKGAGSEMVERGTVLFGTLPSMRWEYEAPEKKSFVFDGMRSYFYVPDARQVTVTELTEEQRGALPFLFLADPAVRERNFRRRERVSRGLATIRLEPRSKESPIREVVLTATVADHVLRKVEYTDRLGNKTSFELSNVVKKNLPEATFRFTPPPGVQVIEN